MYIKLPTFALSKFHQWVATPTVIVVGLFLCTYLNNNKTEQYPRKLVVMTGLSPLMDFDSGKGCTVFFMPTKYQKTSKC